MRAFLAILLFALAVVQSLEALTVTRNPYLQSGAPARITVRGHTDLATNSRVRYGTNPASLTVDRHPPLMQQSP